MSQLEDLQPSAAVRGILPDALVTVVSVQWFGSEAVELTYKDPDGRLAKRLLYRHDEAAMLDAEDFEDLEDTEHRDTLSYRESLRQPFHREPDFDVTSVNYDFARLLERAEPPS